MPGNGYTLLSDLGLDNGTPRPREPRPLEPEPHLVDDGRRDLEGVLEPDHRQLQHSVVALAEKN